LPCELLRRREVCGGASIKKARSQETVAVHVYKEGTGGDDCRGASIKKDSNNERRLQDTSIKKELAETVAGHVYKEGTRGDGCGTRL